MNERIPVVDDEPIVTEVIERYLVREGYRSARRRDRREGELQIEMFSLPRPDGARGWHMVGIQRA